MKYRLLALILALLLVLCLMTGTAEDSTPIDTEETVAREVEDFQLGQDGDTPESAPEVIEAPQEEFVQPDGEPESSEVKTEPDTVTDQTEETEDADDTPLDHEICQHPVTVTVVDRNAHNIHYADLHDGTHRVSGAGVRVTVCADCGVVISQENEFTEKCDYGQGEDGLSVCQWCDHVQGDDGRHRHEFTGEYKDFCGALIEARPAENDREMAHICVYQKTRARKCVKCEAYSDPQVVSGETVEIREQHVCDANGRCVICGYERTCRHDGGIVQNITLKDESYTFVNAAYHEYTALRYVQSCCAKCGAPLENATVSQVTQQHPHHFDNGICRDCGYVNLCHHPNMVYTYKTDADEAKFEPLDALNHVAVHGQGLTITSAYCPDCGFSEKNLRMSASEDQTVTLPHRLDANGVCVDCGYAPEVQMVDCDHPREYRVSIDQSDVEALKQNCRYTVDAAASTDTQHALIVEYDPSWVCTRCGYRMDLSGDPQTITVHEKHHFYNGYCVTANCGYKCAHSRVDGEMSTGEKYYDYDDASGHYEVTPTVATGVCEICGEPVRNHVIETLRGKLLPHEMSDGICEKCHYVCKHPSSEVVQLLPAIHTECESVDGSTHIFRELKVTETICKACGYTLFEMKEPMASRVETHHFVDGVCTACGYAASREAVIDEMGEYEDLPSDERLNGVCVDDDLDLLKFNAQIGECLQAQIEAGEIDASIEHISELFTESELKRLKKLPLSDQLTAVECFLDFGLSLKDQAVTITESETQDLIDDIQSRIDEMTQGERAALKARIQEYCPMTRFEVMPGVTTEVLNIDLLLKQGEDTTRCRYSFYDTGSKWMLINISAQ